MYKIKLIILFSLLFVLLPLLGRDILHSCKSAATTTNNMLIPVKAGKTFVVNKVYDLEGGEFEIPQDVTLVAGRGVIKNGTLIGKGTKIKGMRVLFDHVTIQGSWNVPEISTSLFKDLANDNSLIDVFALSSSDVQNRIRIEDGDYYVSTTSYGFALNLQSNTEISLIGRIHLRPNDFRGYTVLGINKKENIIINGNGLIEGDRQKHTGTSGEWGHGINILEGKNVRVSGIQVINCWGDCIYVGNNSENVTIDNCSLSKGRRQGISITSGKHIKVSNCLISDIFGTNPQYAIDIEPNVDEIVDDVLLDCVKVVNCVGGFKLWGGAKGARIGAILVQNCTLVNPSHSYPVRFDWAKKLIVENCDFDTKMKPGIVVYNIDEVVIERNVVRTGNSRTISVYSEKTKRVNNNSIIK